MDLSSPLRSLIPSMDSAVLEVLARTESTMSASAIVRMAPRGSRSGILHAISRLVEHGLVHAEPSNTGPLYGLNRRHLLAPAVLSAVSAGRELLERLRDEIAALHPQPERALVFGSFARGEAHTDSDIDLLLIVPEHVDPESDAWLEQLRAIVDRVLTWTGNRLQPIVLTASGLREVERAGEPIVDEWRRDALNLLQDTSGRVIE